MAQSQREPTEEGMSETTSMVSVGTLSPLLSEVGREGFPGETAKVARASMA